MKIIDGMLFRGVGILVDLIANCSHKMCLACAQIEVQLSDRTGFPTTCGGNACHLPSNKVISATAPANSIGSTHSNASTTATEITIRQNISSLLTPILQQYPEPYNSKRLPENVVQMEERSGEVAPHNKESPQRAKRQGRNALRDLGRAITATCLILTCLDRGG
jgi:hypothetical protein